MPLHRLTRITIGVPNVAETAAYYTEFGLNPGGDAAFSSVDGGEQLRIAHAPIRRLLELGVGVEDSDDLHRIASRLARIEASHVLHDGRLTATDPGTGVTVSVTPSPRISRQTNPAPPSNGPGRHERTNDRAPGLLRQTPVRPRKLGHVVLGSTDLEASGRFFIDGLGFKVSDRAGDVAMFLRCSDDHHNVLIQAAPVAFLHHSSWEVEDIDEIGRGAHKLLEGHPERHIWGLGRHHIGSNFFWYFKDPAGNFSEYYSDMDCILDDAIWQPEVFTDLRAIYNWGPPVPASFIQPDDLAALMAGAHTG
jgi:catechol 2,3-dioxygenase-like lactoylglutathione lyase family enzyme